MLSSILTWFNPDELATVLAILVLFITVCVGQFSRTYMKGDSLYQAFFFNVFTLITSVILMLLTDNLILFFCFWCISNMTLVKLMTHKASWPAARASGLLARNNYIIGAVFIGIGFYLLYAQTHQLRISEIIQASDHSYMILTALLCILVGAITQSGIWPFHRWLVSSLNSPTPVSALMHAGLVNGGGLLIARFAPLYSQYSSLLDLLFILGLISAIMGTLWKLIQSDIKRMLACSTMGQMGFMLVQCGLGLFSAAIAHVILHGLFKAYLFLKSGNAAQEPRYRLTFSEVPSKVNFALALLCGLIGSLGFAYITELSWNAGNSSVILLLVAQMGITQLALPLIQDEKRIIPVHTIILSLVMGLLYGFTVHILTSFLAPLHLSHPIPLNFIHFIGVGSMVIVWLLGIFFNTESQNPQMQKFFNRFYVYVLNTSQPHKNTVTTIRNHYEK